MSDQFEQPTQERFKVADYSGKLLVITPHSVEKKTFGKDETDVAICDVVVVDVNPPEHWQNAWITASVLYRTLSTKIGKQVLGRLAQGEKGTSPQAPWVLTEYTEDDAKLAAKVIAKLAEAAPASEAFSTE